MISAFGVEHTVSKGYGVLRTYRQVGAKATAPIRLKAGKLKPARKSKPEPKHKKSLQVGF